MRINTRGRLLRRNHVWFESICDISELESKDMLCDEVIIHGNRVPLYGNHIRNDMQNSLITDLGQEENVLMQKLSKTVRNEINRSRKDDVICMVFSSNDVLNDEALMNEFESTYVSMYEEKGKAGMHLDRGEIRGYCSNNAFILTCAQISAAIKVYHSYVYNNNHCRLLHSCSKYREEDANMRNAMGRANKYLHWKDMIFFKQAGVIMYDWGGVSSLSEPNGIDVFKMSFGGEPVKYYNIHVACSLKQRIVDKLR